MLKAVKVSAELHNRFGRGVEEIEAVELSRDIIRKLRECEWH